MPINVSGFNVPETPYREYGGTSDFVNAQLQNRRFEYQKQKQEEEDQWRKLGLIQELTNIDKYQTGESVADAIGHQKANDIFSKYTALAGTMTPAELQYKIAQDIGSTTNAMRGLKDELTLADQQVKARKAQFPSLDAGTLVRDVRADIINRRIQGTDFANPMSVNPSQLNLDDMDFLSDYIDVNKGLKDAIVNPKNIQKDVPVLTGSPSSYTKFTGSLPYFMKENFDRTKDFKDGFYSGKSEPTMSLKTSTIPQGSFSGVNQAIDVLDKDAFEALRAESAEVEPALIKLAKTKYKNYGSMSNADKEIAKRDVAKDFINPFTSNYQFRAETATKPPHYSSTTNVYGSKDVNVNDLYGRILDRVEGYAKDGFYTRGNSLKGDELEAVRKAVGNNQLEVSDFFLAKNDEGIGVYKVDNGEMHPTETNLITTLPKIKTNTNVAAGVPEKRKIAGQGEDTKPKQNDQSYYNNQSNVQSRDGNKITYKDGSVWEISGGKLKRVN